MRLAVLPDFPAEGWPSMDLCGDMLLAHLPAASRHVPPFVRLFSRLPHRAGFNADRLVNRHLVYPPFARRLAGRFDAFHVVDHSYAHLVLSLPAARTGVCCHDLDAFRCLFDPAADRRPWWFRALARRTLAGLQRAAVVFAISAATRDGLIRHGLADPARILVVPLGVAPEFTPGDERRGLSPPNPPVLLHVGSCIPRKRIDVLLGVVAAVPGVRLLKVGGQWTPAQREQIARLNLAGVIDHRTDLTRAEVADAYRTASVVLVPSESEGFGLPVIEALACGVPVVASDLPVLREVGGDAVTFAPVADVPAWAAAVSRVLRGDGPDRSTRLAHAARYSWSNHAATVADAYARM
jgi:glycosyltransferase involved in cell wall biosynthesis